MTGNPIRKSILNLPDSSSKQKKREQTLLTNPAVRILILGGSQGAHFLNELVPEAIQLIQSDFMIFLLMQKK